MFDCYILVGGEVTQPPRATSTALPRIIVLPLSNAIYLNNLVSVFNLQPHSEIVAWRKQSGHLLEVHQVWGMWLGGEVWINCRIGHDDERQRRDSIMGRHI